MIPKFRAWDKRKNVMRDVAVLHFTKNGKINSIEYWINPTELKAYHVRNIELMQSTGLEDKNGVEIFEGDILHRKVHVILLGTDLNKWVDEYVHVEWKYGGWHVGEDLLEFVLEEGIDRHTGCTQTALEVVGNIWENPDLLDSDLVEVER